MTTLDFTVNETSICFYNSITGKETITVNGEVVSEKRSFFGTRHEFFIEGDTYEVITSQVIGNIIGIKVQVLKNGELIAEQKDGQSILHIIIGSVVAALIVTFLFR